MNKSQLKLKDQMPRTGSSKQAQKESSIPTEGSNFNPFEKRVFSF